MIVSGTGDVPNLTGKCIYGTKTEFPTEIECRVFETEARKNLRTELAQRLVKVLQIDTMCYKSDESGINTKPD